MKADVSAPKPDGLMDELRQVWGVIPSKALFGVLVLSWGCLFSFLGNSTFGYVDTPSLLAWMYNSYNVANSEDGHGNLIPFVVIALLWLKREELAKIRPVSSWAPLLIVVLGLLVHGVGYVIQQPRLSIVGFFVGLYGIVGQVWGLAVMRAILFPFVLFGFCVPLGSLADNVTLPLRILVSKIAVGLSQTVLGIDVHRDGSQIFDAYHKFRYDVAAACSGIRSLISLLVLSTIYGAVTFRTLWKRGLMVVLAVPLAVAGNVLRIMGVIVAAEAFGQEAGQTVETKLGFVTFVFAIGVMVILSRFLEDPPTNETTSGSKSRATVSPVS